MRIYNLNNKNNIQPYALPLSIKHLKSLPLIQNILAVASGTAAAQVVILAFAPLITRIYSPEIFGLQGLFLSLMSIIGPVIALRYPMAIVVAKSECDAQRLSTLSLAIALAVACLFGLVLLYVQHNLLKMMGAEALGALIWLLPLALFCVAMHDVANFRAARQGAFRVVGLVAILQAFATNLARVLGGLVSPVAAILVTVTSVAPAIQAAMLGIGMRKTRWPAPPLAKGDVISLLKSHRDFPLYRMPTDVLNAASQAVPVILLAALFSPAAAGLYVLARSVLNVPANVIGTAIGHVFYARFAELARDGKALLPVWLRATGALAALGPVIIGSAWFAPQAFAFAFGDQWYEAGKYTQWMAIWISIMIANTPTVRILPIIHSQGSYLIYNVLLLIARTLSFFVVYWTSGTALSAVACFSMVSVTCTFSANIFYYRRIIAFDRRRMCV